MKTIDRLLGSLQHGLRFSSNEVNFKGSAKRVLDEIARRPGGEALLREASVHRTAAGYTLTITSLCFSSNRHEDTTEAVCRIFGDFCIVIDDQWVRDNGGRDVVYLPRGAEAGRLIRQAIRPWREIRPLSPEGLYFALSSFESGANRSEREWRMVRRTPGDRLTLPHEWVRGVHVTSEPEREQVAAYFDAAGLVRPSIEVEVQKFSDIDLELLHL